MTSAMRTLLILLPLVTLVGCAPDKEGPATPRLVASLDTANRVVFVDPAYAERVAKLWRVENAAANQWTISRGRDKPMLVDVVRRGLDGAAADTADVVYEGCTCSGNHPPGTDDLPCMAGPGGEGSMQIKQTVGYSYCKSSKRGDLCEGTTVQVGDWIYYSDSACSTERRRVPFTKNVCFP